MESQVIVRIVIVGPSLEGLRCSCVSGESCIFLCFRGVLCILETFCKRVPEQPGQQQDPAQPTPANENIRIFEEKRWWSDPTSAKHMRQSIRICVRLPLTRGVQMFLEIRSSDIEIAGTVSTWSRGVVLVKPRAVTSAPPTVGPRKFPSANAVKWNVG